MIPPKSLRSHHGSPAQRIAHADVIGRVVNDSGNTKGKKCGARNRVTSTVKRLPPPHHQRTNKKHVKKTNLLRFRRLA
jgi:hypothetical protein